MQDLQEKILSDYNIIIRSYENNKVTDISSFLKEINKITDLVEESTIQLLDCDYICGQSHLYQGISQAIKAFNEHQNFAKDKGLEICVRTSAQKQISEALKLLGIKQEGNITVVYINVNEEQIIKTEELLSSRNDSLIEVYDVEKIVNAYGLNYSDNIVNSINEKIALLALKS
jgi:KEOPS complex subunit Cgi121